MPGYFLISCSKPSLRWSVVLMPGVTLMPATVPFLPIAFASASAAARPPAGLSVETFVNATGALMNVSTVATGIPALIALLIGAISAVLSVGAIRIASGCRAIAAFRYGICVGGLNAFGEPVKISLTASFAASACAAFLIVR